MITRETIPREISLFEFFEKSKLTLTVETRESAHKKQYVKLYVKGHTLSENINKGCGRSETIYPDFTVKNDNLRWAVFKFIDLIQGEGIYKDKKLVVKVPVLSRHINSEDFWYVKKIQGPKAISIFDFVEDNNLELVISTGENVSGAKTVSARINGYGIVNEYVGNGIKLAQGCANNERDAIRKLIDRISENNIAPSYYQSGWSMVDESKKIDVPALFGELNGKN